MKTSTTVTTEGLSEKIVHSSNLSEARADKRRNGKLKSSLITEVKPEFEPETNSTEIDGKNTYARALIEIGSDGHITLIKSMKINSEAFKILNVFRSGVLISKLDVKSVNKELSKISCSPVLGPKVLKVLNRNKFSAETVEREANYLFRDLLLVKIDRIKGNVPRQTELALACKMGDIDNMLRSLKSSGHLYTKSLTVIVNSIIMQTRGNTNPIWDDLIATFSKSDLEGRVALRNTLTSINEVISI